MVKCCYTCEHIKKLKQDDNGDFDAYCDGYGANVTINSPTEFWCYAYDLNSQLEMTTE